jgi:NAD(P)-dependent dehydrogenase (short-subunit alcohol dehydrogenase family)
VQGLGSLDIVVCNAGRQQSKPSILDITTAEFEATNDRRHRLRRIDYYPSEEAAAIINKLRTRGVGGDASSILNRILSEWAAIPEANTGEQMAKCR